ncbi:MAG: recombinase family protein [Bacillota bacterium]
MDGLGVDKVAKELNRLGYKTNRGRYFSGNAITRMIRAEIYKSVIISNRVKGRNLHVGKLRPKDQCCKQIPPLLKIYINCIMAD